MSSISNRDCYYEEDILYSIIGVLNIKISKVNYNIGWHKALCEIVNEVFKQNNDTSILTVPGKLCEKIGLCWAPNSQKDIFIPFMTTQPEIKLMHASIDGLEIHLKKESYLLIQCGEMYAHHGISSENLWNETYYGLIKQDTKIINKYYDKII